MPIKEIVNLIGKGGLFRNENGLIYSLFFTSELDINLVSVGYEYVDSAPNVEFFTFDLRKIKNEDTGEIEAQNPTVQSPIP